MIHAAQFYLPESCSKLATADFLVCSRWLWLLHGQGRDHHGGPALSCVVSVLLLLDRARPKSIIRCALLGLLASTYRRATLLLAARRSCFKMPNLRTRKSTADARVTLVTLAASDAAEPDERSSPIASSSTATPRTKRSTPLKIKAEVDDFEEPQGAAQLATPVKPTQRKRSRTSTLKEESDDDIKPLKKSPSKSRPPSPTKLRAKLEVAHPEPARWRETYEIVCLPQLFRSFPTIAYSLS